MLLCTCRCNDIVMRMIIAGGEIQRARNRCTIKCNRTILKEVRMLIQHMMEVLANRMLMCMRMKAQMRLRIELIHSIAQQNVGCGCSSKWWWCGRWTYQRCWWRFSKFCICRRWLRRRWRWCYKWIKNDIETLHKNEHLTVKLLFGDERHFISDLSYAEAFAVGLKFKSFDSCVSSIFDKSKAELAFADFGRSSSIWLNA